MNDEPDAFDDDGEELDRPDSDSFEDEQLDRRGTSECDGLCDPQCTWCLVAHACPDDCAGGECPYETLAKQERDKDAQADIRDRLSTALANASREPTKGAITGALDAVCAWSGKAPRDLLPLLEELVSVELHGEAAR